jgi:hypothetical protein
MFWGSTLVAVGIPTAACRVVHSYVQAIPKVYYFQCLRVKVLATAVVVTDAML